MATAPSLAISRQRTLKRTVHCSGVGVHTGAHCTVRLEAAAIDSGRSFISSKGKVLPAHFDRLCGSAYQTVIGNDSFRVQTPEHLLAAAMLLDIDNLHIHIDGPEVPIFDGSALPWIQLFHKAGIHTQDAPAQYASVGAHSLSMNESTLSVEPSDALSLRVSVDFPHPAIGYQQAFFAHSELLHQLAPAQTFGFKADLPKLKAIGLAHGADLSNTLVYDSHALINPQKRRFVQEPLHHKALDIIGDFSLLNQRIRADITAHRPSHALNQQWLKAHALIQET